MNTKPLKIALAGNPNSGKTSVFNQLTGLSLKVGNFAGVTVEKISGTIKHDGQTWEFTDFPGTYSLYPKSEDEKVSTEAFTEWDNPTHPDIVVYVADYAQLQRNLLLFTQLADLKMPLVLAINKTDLGDAANAQAIGAQAEKVTGVKTVLLSAHKNIGFDDLKTAIQNAVPAQKPFWKLPAHRHIEILQHNEGKAIHSLYGSYVSMVNHDKIHDAQTIQLQEIEERQHAIAKMSASITAKIKTVKNREATKKIDKILTHKIAGPILFILALYIVFQSIFKLAQYPMDAIEAGFGWLSDNLATLLPQGFVNNLLTRGILPGVAGVIVFVPQIVFLFFFLSLMEESGYMARVAFLSDKLMSKVGLNGKSVVPLLSGAACAIPAMMAARNIENNKDRLITLLVTPLMSCSARLPVYILLISLIVPKGEGSFIFNPQGLVLMGMYVVGIISAVFVAWIFKLLLKNDGTSFFVMEMPDYQMPRWRNIWQVIYVKAASFITQAGKIIVLVSIVLWFLANFAPSNRFEQIEAKYSLPQNTQGLTQQEIDNRISAEKLAASYAGELGHFIEPVIRPLGYDWKIGIALISSFAAREVFVGTMATIYSLGNDDSDLDNLKAKLAAEINPETGKPVFSIAVALSLMMFYAFALQCVSTIAVMYKETKSIKWPVIQFLYLTGMAYLAGFLMYNLLS